MKNFIVIATREFDDYEGMTCIPENHKEHRKIGDIFNCTEERYEYLKLNKAVLLMGIKKVEEPKEEKKETKKKTAKK
jgi:hypothetical protein